jgi:hypothetical protein
MKISGHLPVKLTTDVDGSPVSDKEGDEVKVTLNGALKVHDVERPLTWSGTARYAGAWRP